MSLPLSRATRRAALSEFYAVQSLVFSLHTKATLAVASDVDMPALLPLIFPNLADAVAFAKPTSHCWVAVEDDSAIVGVLTIMTSTDDSSTAELNAFFVRPEYQRRGLGSELMQTGLAFCRGSGISRVTVCSNKGIYDPAIRYYEKLGFVHVREYTVSPGIVLVDLQLQLK